MTVLAIGDIGVLDDMMHIGDEAMFEAAVAELRSRGVSVVGVSSAPAESAQRYDIATVPRLGFAGLDEASSHARLEHLRTAAREDRLEADDPARPAFDALSAADGLLIAGGGNMASRWAVHIWERCALAAMARERGLPVVVSGQTLGPDLTEPHASLVRTLVDNAELVSVREPDSRALVDSWGLSARLGVDDASFLRAADGTPVVASGYDAPGGGGVLVSLSGWFAHRDADAVEEALARTIEAAVAAVGGPLRFHAHFGPATDGAPPRGDAMVHERVRARLRVDSTVVPTGDAAGAARLARGAALLITSRYHPAVFAAAAGVPTLGVMADRYTAIKLRGTLGHWGADALVDMDDLGSSGPDAVVRLHASRERVAADAGARRAAHRAAAALWWDAVAATFRPHH